MRLSVIIPVRNEAAIIRDCLEALQPLRRRGHEVILVDGGSTDGTPGHAEGLVDRLLFSERGRARQMNRGAAAAQGDLLLFLHADVRLPMTADAAIAEGIRAGAEWGRFDVRLTGDGVLFRIIAGFMNRRSRLTGIATGDQCLFVRRVLFEAAGGFSDIELMEDIDLSRRLKSRSEPACLRAKVLVSSRRWEERGVLRTVVGMWLLRLRFALGADPADLARRYD
jgi:rSAM/selenodomain-associated transferase 2